MDRTTLHNLLSSSISSLKTYRQLKPYHLYLATNWYIGELTEGVEVVDVGLFKQLVSATGSKNPIHLTISPRSGVVDSIIFSSKNLESMLGTALTDETAILALMIAAEHLAMLILMTRGKYINRLMLRYSDGVGVYTPSGALYRCTMKRYFQYLKPIEGMVYTDTLSHRPLQRTNLFSNVMNSCYMDSILVALLLSCADYYRVAIFDFDTVDYEYSPLSGVDGTRKMPSICDKDMWFKHLPERGFNAYARSVQVWLHNSFVNMTKPHSTGPTQIGQMVCTSFRKLLNICTSDITLVEQADPSTVYTVLTGIFPKLRITYDTVVSRPNRDVRYVTRTGKSTGHFQYQDFMLSADEYGESIEWGTGITGPILTFQNALSPSFTDYGTIGDETVYYGGRGQNPTRLHKKRAFGEYILNGRYRLAAAIMHHGVRVYSLAEAHSAGGHYTAFLRPYSDSARWYSYDDMGPSFTSVGDIPSDLFTDTGGRRPELLLYEKVL